MKRIIHVLFLLWPIRWKKWVELENIKADIVRADDKLPFNTYRFLTAAIGVRLPWGKLRWQTIVAIMSAINHESKPHVLNLPLLSSKKPKTDENVPWDYPERTLYYWSHLLAKSYGWSLQYIYSIDVDTVLRLMQEILVEEQIEHEFYHMLSDVAYRYNEATRRSEFVPLPRPDWMLTTMDETSIKPVKILASHMPVGNVINLDDILKMQETQP